jgi:hypothetical protein
MRKSDTSFAATATALTADRRDAPARLICLALLLALAALACRIAMVW